MALKIMMTREVKNRMMKMKMKMKTRWPKRWGRRPCVSEGKGQGQGRDGPGDLVPVLLSIGPARQTETEAEAGQRLKTLHARHLRSHSAVPKHVFPLLLPAGIGSSNLARGRRHRWGLLEGEGDGEGERGGSRPVVVHCMQVPVRG